MTTPQLPSNEIPRDAATGEPLEIVAYVFIFPPDGRPAWYDTWEEAFSVASAHGVKYIFPVVNTP